MIGVFKMANYNDEKWRGVKINALTVIGFEHVKRGKSTAWNWICRCDCGELRSIIPLRVLTGHNVSCGCHKSKMTSEWNKTAKLKHGGAIGKSKTRLYNIWHGMKQRCSNKNSHDYFNYGGRGIKVFGEWENSFEAFRDWAYKNGYNDNLSLDRIDVNKGYCPENCKWATAEEQQRNKQKTERYEYKGNLVTLAEIAKDCGVKYVTLYQRIKYHGLSLEEAISAKDRRYKRA
jgi:hypothetical protein